LPDNTTRKDGIMAATAQKPPAKTKQVEPPENGPAYDEMTKYGTHAWDEAFLNVGRYS